MEKQNKVLVKTKYKGGNSEQMRSVKFNPDDEYYTSLSTIDKELNHYGKYFKGKDIICPCDCDILDGKSVYKIVIEFMEESEEWFSSVTGYIYPIKQLTYYTFENGEYKPTALFGDEARDFITENICCNFIRAIVNIGEDYGVKSVTASGFDTNKQEGIKFDEVDYSLYDLIITNPPFSQYRYFMKIIKPLVKMRKNSKKPLDFILLAPFRNRGNPTIGEGLQNKDFYLGFGRRLAVKFERGGHNSSQVKETPVDWITTFDDAQCECNSRNKKSGVDYYIYTENFPTIKTIVMRDGTNPIRIPRQDIIPDNYNGWMQGSVGILNHLNTEEYEWYITNAKGLYNTRNPELNPFNHKASNEMVNFHGIVFKKKAVI